MRWSLQRRLFVFMGLGAVALAAVMSLLVDRTVVREVQRAEAQGLLHTRAAFEALQRHRRDQLFERCRLISELPYFKAAAAVHDPSIPAMEQAEAMGTVAGVARRILLNVDVDALVLTDPHGSPLVAVGPSVERGAEALVPLGLIARRAAQTGAADGILPLGGGLVQVSAVPVEIGGTLLGVLCLGTGLDSRLADSLEDMTGSAVALFGPDRLLARSAGVPEGMEAPLADAWRQARAGSNGDPAARIIEVERMRYRALWVPLEAPGSGTIGAYVVLRSEDNALAFLAQVREGLIVVALLAMVAALGMSYLFARRITRPVASLVRFTEKVAHGDLDSRAEVAAGDEFAVLGDAFNRMTASLAETHAQLLQAGKMAAFGELGAGIAHELRQPLTSIRGYAQLVRSRLPGPEGSAHKHLDLIVHAVDHMTQIVQGLKDFSRRSGFESREVDVNEVIERTALLMRSHLRSRQVRIELDLAPGLPSVRGDANQLQQVLTNLVANARDALKGREAGLIRVESGATPEGDVVLVSVIDNGPGIPPDVLPRIFQSFFTTKPEGEGTGLGLSITEGIVRDHGGQIEVESAPGRGATFRVLIPSGASRLPLNAPAVGAADHRCA